MEVVQTHWKVSGAICISLKASWSKINYSTGIACVTFSFGFRVGFILWTMQWSVSYTQTVTYTYIHIRQSTRQKEMQKKRRSSLCLSVLSTLLSALLQYRLHCYTVIICCVCVHLECGVGHTPVGDCVKQRNTVVVKVSTAVMEISMCLTMKIKHTEIHTFIYICMRVRMGTACLESLQSHSVVTETLWKLLETMLGQLLCENVAISSLVPGEEAMMETFLVILWPGCSKTSLQGRKKKVRKTQTFPNISSHCWLIPAIQQIHGSQTSCSDLCRAKEAIANAVLLFQRLAWWCIMF